MAGAVGITGSGVRSRSINSRSGSSSTGFGFWTGGLGGAGGFTAGIAVVPPSPGRLMTSLGGAFDAPPPAGGALTELDFGTHPLSSASQIWASGVTNPLSNAERISSAVRKTLSSPDFDRSLNMTAI
jgi:hypothetical protein